MRGVQLFYLFVDLRAIDLIANCDKADIKQRPTYKARKITRMQRLQYF